MTTTEERNMELMQTLDDARNAQDRQVFVARHKPDVVVYWPGQPEPTRGIEDHGTPKRSPFPALDWEKVSRVETRHAQSD